MNDIGKVTKLEGSKARIKVDKSDKCAKCGMCLFSTSAGHVEFSAENTVGATVGDSVEISTTENGKLLGIFLCFVVPLIFIGLSCLIGYFLIGKEIWILILSVIFIFLWYTILAIIDKKLNKAIRYKTEIIRITSKGENENESNN